MSSPDEVQMIPLFNSRMTLNIQRSEIRLYMSCFPLPPVYFPCRLRRAIIIRIFYAQAKHNDNCADDYYGEKTREIVVLVGVGVDDLPMTEPISSVLHRIGTGGWCNIDIESVRSLSASAVVKIKLLEIGQKQIHPVKYFRLPLIRRKRRSNDFSDLHPGF